MQKLKKALKKLVKATAGGGHKKTSAAKSPPVKSAVKSTGKGASKASAKAASKPTKPTAKAPAMAAKAAAKSPLKTASTVKPPLKKTTATAKSPAVPAQATEKPKKAAVAVEPKKEKVKVVKAKPVKTDQEKLKATLADIAVKENRSEEAEDEIFLTDAEGRRYCRVRECDQLATVDTYCRYHYLLYWKKIQVRKKILTEGKLERYIEELTARYPDKYLEMLRKDLRHEKDFLAAIQELEIDDNSNEGEFEDEAQSYLEEVRGIGSESGTERADDDY